MIAALVLAAAPLVAPAASPAIEPEPPAVATSQELFGYEKCRLYNCGVRLDGLKELIERLKREGKLK